MLVLSSPTTHLPKTRCMTSENVVIYISFFKPEQGIIYVIPKLLFYIACDAPIGFINVCETWWKLDQHTRPPISKLLLLSYTFHDLRCCLPITPESTSPSHQRVPPHHTREYLPITPESTSIHRLWSIYKIHLICVAQYGRNIR